MQQFRREFDQSKCIVQLMLERENLSEVSFRTQRDIFAEEAKELGFPIPGESESENPQNLTYEPLFKQLWAPVSKSILVLIRISTSIVEPMERTGGCRGNGCCWGDGNRHQPW